jgi:hypothetical protein
VTLGLAGATWSALQSQTEPPVTGPISTGSGIDGRIVFMAKGCTGCHSRAGVPGSAMIGPNLTDLATRAGSRVAGLTAGDYVRQSLLEPQAFLVEGYFEQMPTLPLSPNEIDLLIDFLLSA